MRLVRRVEVNYLRSLYRAVLDQPGDLNLVFGRNDSGKSNVLRALNLFFNGDPEPNKELDFKIDFSDIRREEARVAKGKQFVSVRVDFNVPSNYQKSLGQVVSVKRQWNINGDMSEIPPRSLSTGQKIQLSKFLNRIDFTYVPAIKDLDMFGDLIERMYQAAAQSSGFQRATSSFVDSIRSETSELSSGLSKLFESTTQLAAPSEMGLLFRSLDFSHGENGHSLLRQKGDGVKARHIPELLRYINEKENGKAYFVWGFEEPENSLDFASAEAEAKTFSRISSRSDTQIFITSHSPAFYLAEQETRRQVVRRYFVNKQQIANPEIGRVEPANAISTIDTLEDAERRMAEASLMQLPFLIKRWSELKEQNTRLEELGQKLRSQLAEAQTPILYVEGKHDKALFERALSKIGVPEASIAVKTLGGTPKDTSDLLLSLAASGGSVLNCPTMFIFDNDRAGRAAYANLCKDKVPGDSPKKVSDKLSAWALPCTQEVKQFCDKYTIPKEALYFVSEFLFDGDEAAKLCLSLMNEAQRKAAVFTISDSYYRAVPQKQAYRLHAAEPGSAEWLWARGVPDDLKSRYLERARATLDPARVLHVVQLAAATLSVIPPQKAQAAKAA
jgi:hypothetical protein